MQRALVLVMVATVGLACTSNGGVGDSEDLLPASIADIETAPVEFEPRWSTAAVIDGNVYLWGGEAGSKVEPAVLDTGYEITLGDASQEPVLREISPAPIAGRGGHVTAGVGGELFVWGGVGASGQGLGTGAVYSPGTDSWRTVAEGPPPVSNAMARVVDRSVLIGGGTLPDAGSAVNRRIFRYDLDSDDWSTVVEAEYDVLDWEMDDRGLVVMLGDSGTGSELVIEVFRPDSGERVSTTQVDRLENAAYFALSVLPDKAVVMQGTREKLATTRFDRSTDGWEMDGGATLVAESSYAPSLSSNRRSWSADFDLPTGGVLTFGVRELIQFGPEGDGGRMLGRLACRDGALVARIDESSFLRLGGEPCGGTGAGDDGTSWQTIRLS